MRFGLLTHWYATEAGPGVLPGVLARGPRAAGDEVQVDYVFHAATLKQLLLRIPEMQRMVGALA